MRLVVFRSIVDEGTFVKGLCERIGSRAKGES